MSETNCPHCGKPAGVICIVAECPVRPPPPDPARITELQRRLAEGSVSNDPLIARVEALTRTVEGNLSPSQHQGDWVTVPREPTLNMIAEAAKALRWEDRASAIETVKPVLAAALAAAPPPPSPSEGVVEQIARIVKDGFIKRLPFEETARQIAALQASGEGEEGSLLHAGMTDPAPGAEPETAWLIERNGQWYAAAPHSRWTTQQAIDASTWRENWTSDANKALRFARKCDAETLIRYESLQNAVATEHVWLEREEWPDLRDPRNIRRALRQAQDNLERAAASPAPGDDFTPDGNCRAVEAARQIAALQGSEGGHAGKLEGAPTGGAAHLLGGERATLWQPMTTAPRDGSYIIAKVGDAGEQREHWAGRPFAVRFDKPCGGWAVFPGFGGAPDEWFTEWTPVPPSPTKQAPEAPPVTAERSSPHEQNTPSPPDTPEAIGAEVEERVARAICAAYGARYDNAFGSMSLETLDAHRAARAALSALHQAGKLP